jgi:hypothetical protein
MPLISTATFLITDDFALSQPTSLPRRAAPMNMKYNEGSRKYQMDTAIEDGPNVQAALTHDKERKSILLSLNPMTVEFRGERICSRCYELFGGPPSLRIKIADAPRFSEKTLSKLAAQLDEDISTAARLWLQNPDASKAILQKYAVA